MGNSQPVIPPPYCVKSPVYRHIKSPDRLIDHFYEDCYTTGMAVNPNGFVYAYRTKLNDNNLGDYIYVSYRDMWKRIQNYGSGLRVLDIVPEHKFIGIYVNNCLEWSLTEQSASCYGYVIVPLYSGMGINSIKYIINFVPLNTVLVSKIEYDVIIKNIKDFDKIKTLILTCEKTPEMVKEAKFHKITLYTVGEVENYGRKNPIKPKRPNKEDWGTISFTSGTTGQPKGVILTLNHFVSDISGCYYVDIRGRKTDTYLSFLPMAHTLERVMQHAIFIDGGCIYYYSGSTKLIQSDLVKVRPTVLTAVPRLLNKIYDVIHMKVASQTPVVQSLFNQAVNVKLEYLKYGYLNNTVWDNLVFNKITEQAGVNNVRLVISGSAALTDKVSNFLRILLSAPVLEGYGQTETCGAATLMFNNDYSSGNVGGPIASCEYKIINADDMGYSVNDIEHCGLEIKGRGELCMRGYNIFKGYYNDDKATKDTIDEEGWHHTGDCVCILPNYSMKVIDRKRNIIKLSQGEFVATEHLENIYGQSNFISQIYIHGESSKSTLVAIIVPDEDYIYKWSKDKENLKYLEFEELMESDEVRKNIEEDLIRIHKENGLRGFEKIGDFYLENEEFSTGNNLMTCTFKLQRNNARKRYEDIINQMYEKLP